MEFLNKERSSEILEELKDTIAEDYYCYTIKPPGKLNIWEGYVGISKHPLKRWVEHRMEARESPYPLYQQMRLLGYEGEKDYNPLRGVQFQLIARSEDVTDIVSLERACRSKKYMGWNQDIGGRSYTYCYYKGPRGGKKYREARVDSDLVDKYRQLLKKWFPEGYPYAVDYAAIK